MSRSNNTDKRRDNNIRMRRRLKLFNKNFSGEGLSPEEQSEHDSIGYIEHSPRYGNKRKSIAKDKIRSRRVERRKLNKQMDE